ncbi:MAG: hypothetical protein HYU99_04445 [Deltaproteobacteria bacterium]|nr:hypothetical protein [Deltaproteobacteria bacterium]
MKTIKLWLLSVIFVLISSPFARALTVKPLSLDQLTRMAPRIVQVTCEDKQVELDEAESGLSVTWYTFEVLECLKGDCPEHLTIKQVAQGTESSGNSMARVNFGLPEYEVGKTYLLFLAGDSDKTGLTAPMGVFQGHFPMEKTGGKWTIPDLHTRKTLFKNMEAKLPGKGAMLKKLGSSGSSGDYEEFKSVINAILEK